MPQIFLKNVVPHVTTKVVMEVIAALASVPHQLVMDQKEVLFVDIIIIIAIKMHPDQMNIDATLMLYSHIIV